MPGKVASALKWRSGRDPISLLLLGLLAFGLLYRLHAAFDLKQGLSYDESISYLCSAAT